MKMKMMKNWMIVIVGMLVLASCEEKGATVSGSLTNAEGETVVLEKLSSKDVEQLDSVQLDNDGTFKLKVEELTQQAFYRLRLGDNNFVILLLQQGDKAVVNGNALEFYKSYEVTGSEGSVKLRQLDGELRKAYEKTDSLRTVFQRYQQSGGTNMDSIMALVDQAYQQAQSEKAEYVKAFIEENPNSLAMLSAVQSLDPAENLELYEKVAAQLETAMPGSEYVRTFKTRINDIKTKQQASQRTEVGSPAPEIALKTPEGETIKLSDFRGQVTLIDFWAAWCKPCRMENPNVVRLYNEYKDQGFEIFGVSLDKDREAWLQAIKADGLTWKHGSELKFWQSSFVPVYNLEGIPMTYLVDEEGVIIAKGLRGQELEAKLEEIFSPS